MNVIGGELSLLSGVCSQDAVRLSSAMDNHADPATDSVLNEKRW